MKSDGQWKGEFYLSRDFLSSELEDWRKATIRIKTVFGYVKLDTKRTRVFICVGNNGEMVRYRWYWFYRLFKWMGVM